MDRPTPDPNVTQQQLVRQALVLADTLRLLDRVRYRETADEPYNKTDLIDHAEQLERFARAKLPLPLEEARAALHRRLDLAEQIARRLQTEQPTQPHTTGEGGERSSKRGFLRSVVGFLKPATDTKALATKLLGEMAEQRRVINDIR